MGHAQATECSNMLMNKPRARGSGRQSLAAELHSFIGFGRCKAGGPPVMELDSQDLSSSPATANIG